MSTDMELSRPARVARIALWLSMPILAAAFEQVYRDENQSLLDLSGSLANTVWSRLSSQLC